MFTHVYLCLLAFSYVYHCFLMHVYLFAHVYSCLPMFTLVYHCLILLTHLPGHLHFTGTELKSSYLMMGVTSGHSDGHVTLV